MIKKTIFAWLHYSQTYLFVLMSCESELELIRFLIKSYKNGRKGKKCEKKNKTAFDIMTYLGF